MTNMWTGGGGGPPQAYIDMILCRDIFHCTPAELAEQDEDTVLLLLEMHVTEREIIAKRRKMKR